MKNKEKIKIAKQIIELEKLCRGAVGSSQYMNQITELIKDLPLEDLLFIDEYILENILKK